MNHPLKQILELYIKNRKSLATALSIAGGKAETILDQDQWLEVQTILAANNIIITATYASNLKGQFNEI